MTTLVRHAMAETPRTLTPEMNVADAAGLMSQFDIGVVPVCDHDGKLLGLVTDRDIVLRVVAKRHDPDSTPLSDVLTEHLITASPDQDVEDARELMMRHKVRRLPVMKGDHLVGVVSLGDIAWALASERRAGEALRAISESPTTTEKNEGPDVGTPERRRAAGF